MSFDLCRVRVAQKPYYIENISTSIYSIEELCYYLYQNMYLIDESIVNEKLCDWLRDELGLKKLYKTLYDHLEKQDGTAWFVMPIFREIGYLNPEQMRTYQEKLSQIEVQPGEMRLKLKADYLVRSGMYQNAITEYLQILDHKSPGNLGAVFYAQIWNNLGCAYARLFLFADASTCFRKAWELTQTKEMLRKYVSTLPLFLEKEEYDKVMADLGADSVLTRKIQEYNAKEVQKAQKSAKGRLALEQDHLLALKALKDEYRRQSCFKQQDSI